MPPITISNEVLVTLVIIIILIRDGILLWKAIGRQQTHPSIFPVPTFPTTIPTIPSVSLPTSPAPSSTQLKPYSPPVAPSTVVTPGLIAAVKKLEGFTAHAYDDYKQTSIGYGTKAKPGETSISEAAASERLVEELSAAEKEVEAHAPNALTGVKQALTSLTYNTGIAWANAGLGQKVRANDFAGAKESFLQYNHAGGVVNEGLTNRRKTEVAWFDHPI